MVGVDITSGDGTGYGYALSNVVLGTGVSVVHPLTTLSNRYAQTAIESGGAYEKSNLRFAFAYDLHDSWFRLGKQPTRIARLLGDDAATLQLRAVGRFVSDLSLKSTKFRLQNHHRHRPLSQP